jgi:biphenyl 2,3-dioxygenase subunit beta
MTGPVTPALQHEIEQFLYHEAALLDGGLYHRWLALFTDDVRYWMPARETRGDDDGLAGSQEMALFDDDKAFLIERVRRIDGGRAHAETPPSRTRRLIANVMITPGAPGDHETLDVAANFMVFQARLERTESTYFGRREDGLRRADGGWRIARRKIMLDQTILPRSLSILF